MEEIKIMSNTALINLLANKTVSYTQMLAGNIKTEEFYNCKRAIEQLTAEIELRKGSNNLQRSLLTSTSVSYRNEEY